MNVYIFTNSPGEVFSWVKPICETIFINKPTISIYIFLTPCQYASGEEQTVCSTFDGVKVTYTPIQTIKHIFFNKPFEKGIVYYLGGDPFYAIRFAKKTKSQLLGYSEHHLNNNEFNSIIYQSDDNDLMTASLIPKPLDTRVGLVILPGSRPEHLDVALPFMIDIVSELTIKIPVTIMLSPFTTANTLNKLKKQYPTYPIKKMNDSNDLASFKYALTIPGTNTMQLAVLSIPFLMIIPTHNSKILRLNGIAGLLLLIPIIGHLLKFILLTFLSKSKKLYALPNIRAKKMICPELIGKFSPQDAAKLLDNLIKNDNAIIDELKQFKPNKKPLEDLSKLCLNTIKGLSQNN